MSASISSEHISQRSNGSPSPWPVSPASVTQRLSDPGKFPASQPKSALAPPPAPPVMLPGTAFEIQAFNFDDRAIAHKQPVLKSSDAKLPPMQRLFLRIEKNDRKFFQQLPESPRAQQELGIFLDEPDPASGRTPLTAALAKGHLNVAVELLMLGADPSAVDDTGCTPDGFADEGSMAATVMEFLRLYEKCGPPKSTSSGDAKIYQKLFTKIDPATGNTLLTWAAFQRHQKLVGLIINSGADLRVRNREGHTALDVACLAGNLETIDLLLDAWPTLASDMNRTFLISAICGAVAANRPMVLAQLLSFFRDEYRCREGKVPEQADDNPLDPVSSHPATQQDVYAAFLGGERTSSATMDVIMRRTNSNFLLTSEESQLLKLQEFVELAKEEGHTKIVEIIHAHARLPKDV